MDTTAQRIYESVDVQDQAVDGPTSDSGKAKVSMNGLQHGRRSASVHAAGSVTYALQRLARDLGES